MGCVFLFSRLGEFDIKLNVNNLKIGFFFFPKLQKLKRLYTRKHK